MREGCQERPCHLLYDKENAILCIGKVCLAWGVSWTSDEDKGRKMRSRKCPPPCAVSMAGLATRGFLPDSPGNIRLYLNPNPNMPNLVSSLQLPRTQDVGGSESTPDHGTEAKINLRCQKHQKKIFTKDIGTRKDGKSWGGKPTTHHGLSLTKRGCGGFSYTQRVVFRDLP